MKIPKHIKTGLRIFIGLILILWNTLFVILFISNTDYEEIVYSNGGIIYNFGNVILLSIESYLTKKNIGTELSRIPKNSEVIISEHEQWKVFIHAMIRKNHLFMIFSLFEICLFLIVQYLTSKQIWILLGFGTSLFLFSILDIIGFPILKSRQGYPKLRMKYLIQNNTIELVEKESLKVVDFKDIQLAESFGDIMVVQTEVDPRVLIFKLDYKSTGVNTL